MNSLKDAVKLTTLSIKGEDSAEDILECPTPLSFKFLRKLTLANISISKPSFDNLFSQVNQLASLSLKRLIALDEKQLFLQEQPHLRHLNLEFTDNILNPQMLLQNTPLLEDIRLKIPKIPLGNYFFPSIKKLAIILNEKSENKQQALQSLVNAIPQDHTLKEFKLASDNRLSTNLLFNDLVNPINTDLLIFDSINLNHSKIISLPRVKEIQFLCCIMNFATLINLINHTSYLKTIHLDCRIPPQITDFIIKKGITINMEEEEEENYLTNLEITPDLSPVVENTLKQTANLPRFDANRYINYRNDSAQEKPFTFDGQVCNTFEQTMITKKLAQFLLLTKQADYTIINKIQDGICRALCVWLNGHEQEQALQQFAAWDGLLTSLNQELISHFNSLYEVVKGCYFNPAKKQAKIFVGSLLTLYLNEEDLTYIISNPWHAVRVNYHSTTQYSFYDPNFREGIIKYLSREEIIAYIHSSLGSLLMIDGFTSAITPVIQVNDFLGQGGLLVLNQSENAPELLDYIITFGERKINSGALKGLLLRGCVNSAPAWVQSLTNLLLFNLAFQLVNLFLHNFLGAKAALSKSLDAMPLHEKYRFLRRLSEGMNISPTLLADFQQIIENSSKRLWYEKQLTTWQLKQSEKLTDQDYCVHIVQGQELKRLIECENAQEIEQLQLTLRQYCQTHGIPIFYIEHPNDLVCSADFMRPEGKQAISCKGPGGVLYDFIKTSEIAGTKAILLFDYSKFLTKGNNIYSLHHLLETNRKADGISIPNNICVIGLIAGNQPEASLIKNFYHLFDKVEKCAVLSWQIPLAIEQYQGDVSNPGVYFIDFNQENDWEEKLLGKWDLQNKQILYQEGELESAIRSQKAIVLSNPPQSQKFKRWLRQSQALQRVILANNQTILLPLAFRWQIHENNGLEKFNQNRVDYIGFSATAKTLNPSLLQQFFNRRTLDENNHTYDKSLGILAIHPPHTPLAVNLTRDLQKNEWAKLLSACHQNQIILQVHKASPQEPLKNTITLSNDPDSLIWRHKQTDASALIIDVSECLPEDLMIRIKSELISRSSFQINFSKENSLLEEWRLSDCPYPLLLTGQFSDLLVDFLMDYLFQHPEILSRFKIITTPDNASLALLPHQTHVVTAEEKRRLLAAFYPLEFIDNAITAEQLEQESLTILKARLNYKTLYPHGNSDDEWQGIYNLPVNLANKTCDFSNAQAIAHDFITHRIKVVNEVLKSQPYIIITGLTGTGKTTFVEKFVRPTCAFHQGEEALEAWAKDKCTGFKILFIDEANLSERQWSELEGLFMTPPFIRHNNQIIPISPEHKIIFACNPASYSDERQAAPFFVRHGNARVFEPLPLEYLYINIIKPIFQNSALFNDEQFITTEIFKLYSFLCSISVKEVLISPRELELIIHLVLSFHQRYPEQALNQVIAHYIHFIGNNLVPSEHKADFNKYFPSTPLAHSALPIALRNPAFHTETQKPALELLDDILCLRQYCLNNKLSFAGIGGAVLQGKVCSGKRTLLLDRLNAHGFQELTVNQVPATTQTKCFYRLPASMPADKQLELLNSAARHGVLVVIDNIMAMALPEKALNNLLMGKTSDGKEATAGFMLFATKKPGSSNYGNAIARRLLEIELPENNSEDLKAILQSKGLSPFEAEEMTTVFLEKQSHANLKLLEPAPVLTNLLKLAEDTLRLKSQFNPFKRTSTGFFLTNNQQNSQTSEESNKKPKIP